MVTLARPPARSHAKCQLVSCSRSSATVAIWVRRPTPPLGHVGQGRRRASTPAPLHESSQPAFSASCAALPTAAASVVPIAAGSPLQLIAAAAVPVAKVALFCAVGAWAANRGLLTPEGRRTISALTLHIFTPCLLFSKLAVGVGLGEVTRLWVVSANIVASHVVGLLLGLLAVRLAHVPHRLRNQVVLSCGVGNVGNLPFVLLAGLAVDPALPFAAALGPAVASELAMRYVALSNFVATLIQFPLAYVMLQKPPPPPQLPPPLAPEPTPAAGAGRDAHSANGTVANRNNGGAAGGSSGDDGCSSSSTVGQQQQAQQQGSEPTLLAPRGEVHGGDAPQGEGSVARHMHDTRAEHNAAEESFRRNGADNSRGGASAVGAAAARGGAAAVAAMSGRGTLSSPSSPSSSQTPSPLPTSTPEREPSELAPSELYGQQPLLGGRHSARPEATSSAAAATVATMAAAAVGTAAAVTSSSAPAELDSTAAAPAAATAAAAAAVAPKPPAAPSRWQSLLSGVLSPPSVASILGVGVASVGWLKSALFGPGGSLRLVGEVVDSLGAVCIPALLLVLGANLSRGPGVAAGKLPPSCVAAAVATRLVLLPGVCGAVLMAAWHAGLLPAGTDPLALLVMLVMHATPTAVLVHGMATLFGHAEDEVAALLFWQYAASMATLPLAIGAMLQLIAPAAGAYAAWSRPA